jgi:phospholipase C
MPGLGTSSDKCEELRLTRMRRFGLPLALFALAIMMSAAAVASASGRGHSEHRSGHSTRRDEGGQSNRSATSTPIKHVVVIFQENVSYDHYFGTYPHARNPSGEPAFYPSRRTPTTNGLSGPLLTNNPNLDNPMRLDRSQALTCDQNHGYTAEQKAFDMGAMDKFVQNTDVESCSPPDTTARGLVMDYYDGNTVTGVWNYAQHFAMSDNSYGDSFGPSTPGALNVTAGNTYGALCGPASAVYGGTPCAAAPGTTGGTPGASQPQGTGTTYSDADPNYDICSATQDKNTAATTLAMGGQNIGDLLDEANVSWGWFQGGFASPNYVSGQPSTDDLSAVCTGTHQNIGGATVKDYSPHHEPFQYYSSTANPRHLPPTSVAAIGHQDQADHQYDLKDFWAAADNGNLPSVSYLKAAEYQDGHAGYSDPLDEQHFLVDTINHLEHLSSWKSTAVVIAYDDSDGWYDHQMSPTLTQSQTPLDALTGTGMCGANAPQSGHQARCGFGPRLPLLVISPYSRRNFVDGTVTSQSSVPKFIEDNWLSGERVGGGSNDAITGTLTNMLNFDQHGARQLFLDPTTGEVTGHGSGSNSGWEHRNRR